VIVVKRATREEEISVFPRRWLSLFAALGVVLVAVGCVRKPTKPRWLWVDALANWESIVSPGDIDQLVRKAKKAGFTGLVVDVKPVTGHVMYPSRAGTRLTEWKGAVSPGGFDYLDSFVRMGHENGLQVYASLNVFAGGLRRFQKGLVYEGHRDWQCLANTADGLIPSMDLPHTESVFLQPSRRAVQEYNLSILDEVVRHYPVDGVVLDRVYYPDLSCDFSDAARDAFERFLGHPVRDWPNDVYSYRQNGQRVPGPLFRDWLYFRSKVLYDFVAEARTLVKQVRPRTQFCLYVGAWYPQAKDAGLNWASKTSPLIRFWPDSLFRDVAVGDLFDAVFAGLLYEALVPEEVPKGLPQPWAGWYSVAGAADSMRVALGANARVFGVLLLSRYAKDLGKLCQASQLCLERLSGVAMLDAAYVERLGLWGRLRSCFSRRP
jgi:hypothetical protein